MPITKNLLLWGDALFTLQNLEPEFADLAITSPPYWGQRNYGVDGQLGCEPDPGDYIDSLIKIFREVRRVLKPTGSFFLNLGDSYSGSGKGRWTDGISRVLPKYKQYTITGHADHLSKSIIKSRPFGAAKKSLAGFPWRIALAMIGDGWILRNDIIWHKPNCFPNTTKDRFTNAHEHMFFFTKSRRSYFDYHISKEVGATGGYRHRRDVWSINTKTYKGHKATFPEKLVELPIAICSPPGGVVLDPFMGSGTVGAVAKRMNRMFVGIDLDSKSVGLAEDRINKVK